MCDILLVHIGAGNHAIPKTSIYKKLIRKALSSGDLLSASKVLEISEHTNTGYGSSLNLLGDVECDASFLTYANGDLNGGSMYNIKNKYPIQCVMKSFEQIDKIYANKPSLCRLSPPRCLDFAKASALQNFGVSDHSDETDLVSVAAKDFYTQYKDNIMGPSGFDISPCSEVTDTIGVFEKSRDLTKVASSSGGNFFKFPGRIGCAGVIGGAIAMNYSDTRIVTCLCSGNGDDILFLNLAGATCNKLLYLDASLDFAEELVNSIHEATKLLKKSEINFDQPRQRFYGGIICIVQFLNEGYTKVFYCHSSESFYFGFKNNNNHHNIEVVLSRLNSSSTTGQSMAYGEYKLQ